MNFKIIVIFAVACAALIFVAQNLDVISIRFLFWEMTMSSALLMLFSLLAGFAAGWVLNGYWSYRREKKEVQKIIHQ